MTYCPPADREQELALFQDIITGKSAYRIWLLQADGNMGKSTLLSEIQRNCPDRVMRASVDLSSTLGLHDIFYLLCDALDKKNFPTFAQSVQRLGQVQIKKNVVLGQADIHVALKSPDEGDRAARRSELTGAFFDDLRKIKKSVLLIFDTFNEATAEVQDWLGKIFLPTVQHSPRLMAIIAGRQVPQPGISWCDCCLHYPLPPIANVDAWESYSRRKNYPLKRDWIEAFCVALAGHPGNVDAMLMKAVRGGQ